MKIKKSPIKVVGRQYKKPTEESVKWLIAYLNSFKKKPPDCGIIKVQGLIPLTKDEIAYLEKRNKRELTKQDLENQKKAPLIRKHWSYCESAKDAWRHVDKGGWLALVKPGWIRLLGIDWDEKKSKPRLPKKSKSYVMVPSGTKGKFHIWYLTDNVKVSDLGYKNHEDGEVYHKIRAYLIEYRLDELVAGLKKLTSKNISTGIDDIRKLYPERGDNAAKKTTKGRGFADVELPKEPHKGEIWSYVRMLEFIEQEAALSPDVETGIRQKTCFQIFSEIAKRRTRPHLEHGKHIADLLEELHFAACEKNGLEPARYKHSRKATLKTAKKIGVFTPSVVKKEKRIEQQDMLYIKSNGKITVTEMGMTPDLLEVLLEKLGIKLRGEEILGNQFEQMPMVMFSGSKLWAPLNSNAMSKLRTIIRPVYFGLVQKNWRERDWEDSINALTRDRSVVPFWVDYLQEKWESSEVQNINSMKDYMALKKSLRGTDFIFDRVFSAKGLNNPKNLLFLGRNMGFRLLNTVMDRNYRDKEMLAYILRGDPGIGKSSALPMLFPLPWKDSLAVHGFSLDGTKKDIVEQLKGRVFAEWSEGEDGSGFHKKSAAFEKAFINNPIDTARTPYEKFAASVKRTALLMKTKDRSSTLSGKARKRRYGIVIVENPKKGNPWKNVALERDGFWISAMQLTRALLSKKQEHKRHVVFTEKRKIAMLKAVTENSNQENLHTDIIEFLLEMKARDSSGLSNDDGINHDSFVKDKVLQGISSHALNKALKTHTGAARMRASESITGALTDLGFAQPANHNDKKWYLPTKPDWWGDIECSDYARYGGKFK